MNDQNTPAIDGSDPTTGMKACAHCGSPGKVVDESNEHQNHLACCSKCCATIGYFRSAADAIAAWNERVIPPELAAARKMISRLRGAIMPFAAMHNAKKNQDIIACRGASGKAIIYCDFSNAAIALKESETPTEPAL